MRIPIGPEKDAFKYTKQRFKKLFTFDHIRAMQILESIQYGFSYLLVGFVGGTILDYSFPEFTEEKKPLVVFIEVILQSLLLAIMTFYLKKLVKLTPFLFYIHSSPKVYHPYLTTEYDGEVMIAMGLLGVQFNLVKKMDFLSRKLYAWIYDEERKVENSL